MQPFSYLPVQRVDDAIAAMREPRSRCIAGGTNLLDLMKAEVERPTILIDITRLPLTDVTETADGGLRIGALVRNSDLANHAPVRPIRPTCAWHWRRSMRSWRSTAQAGCADTVVEFHRLPGATPERDTNLRRDELILGITLPRSTFAAKCHYLKVRDRASYAFALVSVAAGLQDGRWPRGGARGPRRCRAQALARPCTERALVGKPSMRQRSAMPAVQPPRMRNRCGITRSRSN